MGRKRKGSFSSLKVSILCLNGTEWRTGNWAGARPDFNSLRDSASPVFERLLNGFLILDQRGESQGREF